jgi:hypothetical protein
MGHSAQTRLGFSAQVSLSGITPNQGIVGSELPQSSRKLIDQMSLPSACSPPEQADLSPAKLIRRASSVKVCGGALSDFVRGRPINRDIQL